AQSISCTLSRSLFGAPLLAKVLSHLLKMADEMPQGDIGLGLFEVVGVAREHVLNTVTAGHAFSKRRLVFVGKHGPADTPLAG
ncbi:MAG: hypothetical protein ACPIOQ_01080, partial [Promethearchaeia archaeon]